MRTTLLLLAALTAGPAFAQSAPTPPPAQPVNFNVPAAAEADVASVDAIIAALYDVISGPVGQARDWNRMRSLFVPTGRLMPVGVRADGSAGMRILQVNDYIASEFVALIDDYVERKYAARGTG